MTRLFDPVALVGLQCRLVYASKCHLPETWLALREGAEISATLCQGEDTRCRWDLRSDSEWSTSALELERECQLMTGESILRYGGYLQFGCLGFVVLKDEENR